MQQQGTPAAMNVHYPVAVKNAGGTQLAKENSASDISAADEAPKELFERHGDKWTVMYHNITAMLGAGVLGLPSTFIFLGWYAGIPCLLASLFISWYSFYLLVQMHEVQPDSKHGALTPPLRRFDTYKQLSQYAFGPKKGWWAVMPFQIAVLYGMGVTYTVTGARNMESAYKLLDGDVGMTKISYFILIFSGVEFLLSLVPDFSALGWVSLMGAAMSAGYSIMAVVLSGLYPKAPSVSYMPGGATGLDTFFGVFTALSTVAFAYGGHNIALEIQATLPAGPDQSTKKPMMFGVHTAFIITGIAYFAVSIAGFWAFGNTVTDNILDSITDPLGAITAAHLAVVLHVLASYQVYMFPLFDMTEVALVKRLQRRGHALERGTASRLTLRYAMRFLYVGTTMFIACLIPFFGDLMGLIGAVAITPTTFILPSILWLTLRRPRRNTFEFWINAIIIFIMTCVGIMGTISAIRSIEKNASTYKPFT